MTIVAFDGMDASSKGTQSRLVQERLEQEYLQQFDLFSFPAYDSIAGELIKTYLTKLGPRDLTDIDSCKMDSIPYSLDRKLYFDKNYRGQDLILDRYYTANIIYQTLYLNKEDKKKYIDWIVNLEVTELGLPKPDLIFFLVVNPERSITNVKNRGRVQDHFETVNVQRAVYNNILTIHEMIPGSVIIKCDDDQGNMRDINEINNEIMTIITEVNTIIPQSIG